MAVSGQPPYGFEWNGDELAVNRPEAAIRLRMFELFIEHGNRGVVARLLNDEGHRTRRGSNWSDNAVTRHLKCQSAIGLYPINKTTKDAAGKRVTKPESEWDYIQCQEIIPKRLWKDAQRLLGAGNVRAARSTVHLFSGLAFCECGEKMRVPTNSPRYVCSACKNKIPIKDLDALFRDELESFLESRADFLSPGGTSPALSTEDAKIAELESRSAKAEELYFAGKIDAERFGEINDPLQREIDILKGDLAKRANRDEKTAKLERKSELLPSSLLGRWDTLKTDQRRPIVETIIDKLVVSESNVDFHMRLLKTPQDLAKSRQTDNLTNTREPGEPEWIRLPSAGKRCELTGLSRSALNNLILPNERNGNQPPVRSKSQRSRGRSRGIRLIHWPSLKAYLSGSD